MLSFKFVRRGKKSCNDSSQGLWDAVEGDSFTVGITNTNRQNLKMSGNFISCGHKHNIEKQTEGYLSGAFLSQISSG